MAPQALQPHHIRKMEILYKAFMNDLIDSSHNAIPNQKKVFFLACKLILIKFNRCERIFFPLIATLEFNRIRFVHHFASVFLAGTGRESISNYVIL